MTKTYGVEEARQALPSLLDLANHGTSSIITRHGRAIAAIVPVDRVPVAHGLSVLSLRGSGSGLWSGDDAIHRQRDEWG